MPNQALSCGGLGNIYNPTDNWSCWGNWL
jgi:hypothetical protein